ncbi:MAG: GAF domain-containing protein, partial [Nitrospirota bacterium]
MKVIIFVLVISVLLQFTAAFLSLRLMRITGRRTAWVFLAAAFSLMAIRRSITLFHMLLGEMQHPPDLMTELVALATSLLIVIGVIFVAPSFISIRDSEKTLRKINRTLKMIFTSNEVLIRANEESALLQDICRTVVEVGGYRLAWIGFTEQDEKKSVRPVAYQGFEEGYLERLNITWEDTERGRGPTGTAIRTGKPAICRNMLTDPKFAPWRAEAVRRGYASSIALPLVANGRTFGTLNIYAEEPDAFDAEEVNLLMVLADGLAYGIMVLRIRKERERAEEFIKNILESIDEGLVVIDPEYRIIAANKSYCNQVRMSVEAIIGRRCYEISHHIDKPCYEKGEECAVKHTFETGKHHTVIHTHYDMEGNPLYMENKSYPIRDLSGNVISAIETIIDVTESVKLKKDMGKRVKELEEFYNMAIGRELKMVELKE